MEVFINVIQQVGFPIFIAVYLLHAYSKKLDQFHAEQARTNLLLVVLVKALTKGNIAIPEEIENEVSGVVDAPKLGGKKP